MLAIGLTRIVSSNACKKFKYFSKEKDVSKNLYNPNNPITSKSSKEKLKIHYLD